ncbi:phage tail tape measure protein [Paenalkalicoccus suaedae]|uniref:Phage tail tape measure protein n=1 Tax=Paenalkalicoccus suaedae TaxID=2592382 RepID=A0A859FFP0_9BACI|nr:phage tail tape measure protein [Paenalkalicoccus suaedae]QKS71949.1 phage tail tape measure protein [Paenalkalicoccus suaedae]
MAFNLEAVLKLRDDFSGEMRKATDEVKKSESIFGGFAKNAGKALLGVSAATAGAMAYSTKQFADFEQGMNEVYTLMPGLSEKAMGEMEGHVLDFSKQFGVLPNETIPALYQAISASVPKDNVFEFLETAQMAAKGGVAPLETAVDGITSVVNAYGSEVLSAAEASDLMFTAVKNGKTDFNQLANTLYNVTPTASALGVEFGDITAALATMTAAGTPTATATTQLRQAFIELSKDGGKASGVFQDMAGKTFTEFIAEGGNVADAFNLMYDAADEMGVGVNDLFGSVEAGAAVLGLTGGSAETFAKNIADMGDSAGATETAFEQMNSGIWASLDRLKAGIVANAIELANEWEPVITSALDGLEAHLPKIQEFISGAFEKVGEVIAWVSNDVIPIATDAIQNVISKAQEFRDYITSNWASIEPIVYGLAGAMVALKTGMIAAQTIDAVTKAWTLYRTAGFGAAAASWGLTAALLANPITWIVAGITGLVLAGIALWRNWDTVKEKATELWAWLRESFSTGKEWVVTKLGELATGAVEKFNELRTRAGESLTQFLESTKSFFAQLPETAAYYLGLMIGQATVWLQQLPARMSEFLIQTRDTAVENLSSMATSFGEWFKAAYDNAIEWASQLPDKIVEFVASIPGRVEGLIGSVKESFASLGRSVIDGFVSGFNKAKDAITGLAGSVFERAVGGFQAARDVGGSFLSGFTAGRSGGASRSHYHGLDRVPFDGYNATLHKGERVLTAQEVKAMDSGAGTGVVISGNTFNVRQESDIDAIASALLAKLEQARLAGA